MKRLLAISLLLIFIAGQVNLTWASHYCMGFKVKSALMLGHGHLDCGMGEMMACDDEGVEYDGPVYQAPSCCSNDYVSSDADDNFSKSNQTLDHQVAFLITYVESYLSYIPQREDKELFVSSSSPLIQPDHQVMYQSFLL